MNKLFISFLATVLFLVLLFLIYYIHVIFFRINVVFYAAIGDVIFSIMIASLIIYQLNVFNSLSRYEKFLLVVIWLLSGYSLAISVPTVLDRSLSFYILEKLKQRGGGIKLDQFSEVFTKEYMFEHRLVDVRLTEQSQSGTIEIVNGCVRLTPKGDKIANLSQFFRRNLLPKKRLLMGEYSDDLTNPFRKSIEVPDYLCQ